MLKIRLSRTGKKSQPSFRVVVQEHTAPIKGKFVEILGYYKPAENPKVVSIDLDRAKYWVSVGAQPSDSVATILKKEGLEGMEKFMAPRDKQRKSKKAVEEAPTPAPAAAPVEAKAEPAPAEAPVETPAPEAESPAEEPAAAPEAPADATAEEAAPTEKSE